MTSSRTSLATSKPRSATPKVLISRTRRYAISWNIANTYAYYLMQYYDPRVWVREGEKTLTARVKEACSDLGNVGMSHVAALLPLSLS